MAVKIILCIAVGILLVVMLSVHRENHKKRRYPEAVIVDGEIVSEDNGKIHKLHLKIRTTDKEEGGKDVE